MGRLRVVHVGDGPAGIDRTLEELARASGVVRRTFFGHFPGRAALLEALGEEAAAKPTEPAERALTHFSLSMWPVGDRYRLLLALAHPPC